MSKSGPPAQQNTDTVSVPIFGNLPATKNGKQLVIVSAKDCGVCNQNHSAFVATGARVDYLESMSEDPRGGRSFPYYTYE